MPVSQSAEAALQMISTDPSKVLGLTVGPNADIKPGQKIPRAETKETPKLSFSGATAGQAYIAVSIDLDAPFASFPVLGPALHWLQSGLTSSSGALEAKDTAVTAEWAAAAPPPMAAPHRYVVLLYEQPADYDMEKFAAPGGGKGYPMSKRIRYSLETFETEAKLGSVVAVNYFNSN